MAARFVDVSESEIDQFKENAVPQKTKLQIINAILLKYRRLIVKSNVANSFVVAQVTHISRLQLITKVYGEHQTIRDLVLKDYQPPGR